MSTTSRTSTPSTPVDGPSPDLSDPAVLGLARRIYYGRFSGRVRAAGVDAEDGFQDVLVGLLTRSRGRSRWDPSRGALSTWIYVATSGIVHHIWTRTTRRIRIDLDPGGDFEDGVGVGWERSAGGVDGDGLSLRLAAESVGLPPEMVRGLLDGQEPYEAACDAGLDWFAASEAAQVAASLGC